MWAPDPPPPRFCPSVSFLLAILFASTTCYLLFVSTHTPSASGTYPTMQTQTMSSPPTLHDSLLTHDINDEIIPTSSTSITIPSHDDQDDHDDHDDDIERRNKKSHDNDDDDDDDDHKKLGDHDDHDDHDDDDDDDKKSRKKDYDKKKDKRKKKDHDDDDHDDKKIKHKKDKNKNKDKKKSKKDKKRDHDDDHHDDHDKDKVHSDDDDEDDDYRKRRSTTTTVPPTTKSTQTTIKPTLQTTRSPTEPYRILLLGDSITYGSYSNHPYQIHLDELMREHNLHVEMKNVGIPGNCVVGDDKYNRCIGRSMWHRARDYLPIDPPASSPQLIDLNGVASLSTSTSTPSTTTTTTHKRSKPLRHLSQFIEIHATQMDEPDETRHDVEQVKWDMVIVLGGTNDIGRNLPPTDTLAGLISIHDRIRTNGAISVALTIPERDGEASHDPPYLYLKEVGSQISEKQLFARRMIINQGLRDYCQHHAPVSHTTRTADDSMPCIFVDFAHEMPYRDDDHTSVSKYWEDRVHPSAAGYDRMAEIIWDEIKDIIPSR